MTGDGRPVAAGAAAYVGGVAFAEPGCSVWEKGRDESDIDPRGGQIVAVTETVDPETGEVARGFRCVRVVRGRPRFETLAQEEIDPSRSEPPNASFLRGMVRLLDREVADHKRGPFTGWHHDCQRAAGLLMDLIMGVEP